MLVRYPSEIDLDRRKRHAPHIRIFMSMIKGGLDDRPSTLKCITQVFAYMMAQAKKMDTGEDEMKKSLEKSAKEWAEKRIAASFSDIPTDMMPSDKEMKEMKEMDKAFENFDKACKLAIEACNDFIEMDINKTTEPTLEPSVKRTKMATQRDEGATL